MPPHIPLKDGPPSPPRPRATFRPQVRALVGLDQQQAVKVWVKASLIAQETNVPLTHRLVESVLGKELSSSYRQAARDWHDYAAADSAYYSTPAHIVAAVRKVYGGTIDLDPASDAKANETVKATRYYTAEDDGLSANNAWEGKVFIHPPVGVVNDEPIQGMFVHRAIKELQAGNATDVVLFLKACIGQKWFNSIFSYPHCWLSERQQKKSTAASAAKDGDKNAASPRGMVVVYMGPRVKEFTDHFSALGHIPGLNGWASAKAAKPDAAKPATATGS